MTHKKTQEQLDILSFISTNDKVLIHAGAGCSKTYIAKEIVKKLKPSKGLYTAFNKGIVEEGRVHFNAYNVECKTFHSIAYQYTNPDSIKELSYASIKENISYKDKKTLLDGINDFFLSSSLDMYNYFANYFKGNQSYLCKLAASYIDSMIERKLPFTFNFMLKYFHFLLDDGLECKYDILILDEINDVTAVFLEIFKLIDAKKKIGLGDSNQAIYQFLKLKNGFHELSEYPVMLLTQSFRCSVNIASSIEKFMVKNVDKNFKFKGTNTPVANRKTLYVTNTNAAIIHLILESFSLNRGFKLLRKVSEIFAYPMAIIVASSGKPLYQSKYKYLETEYKKYANSKVKKSFQNYLLEIITDQETQSAVALLSVLRSKNINLFTLYNKAKEAKPDPKNVIATAYTAKGLEFETVYINDDLNKSIEKILKKGGVENEEDLTQMRVYHVACSRAGKNLINAKHLNN